LFKVCVFPCVCEGFSFFVQATNLLSLIEIVYCNRKKEKAEVLIRFSEAQRAVAPGQVFVLYDGEVCLGSGIIS